MEMPLKPLPTDNLYKFMALGGLACLIFFFWFFESQRLKLLLEEQAWAGEQQQFKLQLAFLGEDETNLFAEVTNQWKRVNELQKMEKPHENHLVTPGTNQLAAEWKSELELNLEHQSSAEEHRKRLRDLRLKEAELKTTSDKLDVTEDELKRLSYKGPIAFGLASLFMLSGFYLWYVRVQVYQDRILRKEAEERAPKVQRRKPSE